MSREPPAVSVVIPTRNRPELLRRALDSVLAQTYGDFEIVVIVDGPDEATERLLRDEPDPRLRFEVNPSPQGGSGARNTGVQLSRGRWIALLDDDDEWLPAKLARQTATLAAGGDRVVSFTRLIARAPHGEYVRPRRAPHPGEHISDYLFVRRSPFAGEGGIQTSTIMAPRELFVAQPFDSSLSRLQDTDWLLRCVAAGATLSFCEEPLTIWNIEQQRPSITTAHESDWRLLVDWIRARRHLVTRRAYASFLLVRGSAATAAARDPRAAWSVVREAFRAGRPGAMDLLLFTGKWIAPRSMRARLRAWLSPGRDRRDGH